MARCLSSLRTVVSTPHSLPRRTSIELSKHTSAKCSLTSRSLRKSSTDAIQESGGRAARRVQRQRGGRIFEGKHAWKFTELEGKRGTEAIYLAFRVDYQGDRVLAFVAGLGSMIQMAFQDKTEFFVLDDLNAQALYNAARNVEIAV